MNKNNKSNVVGSIITILILIVMAIVGANNDGLYSSQAQNVEQVDNLENVTIHTGDGVISKIPNDGNLRVYTLDVGQGDSILVVHNNKTMLIDASTNQMGAKVVQYLKDLGITKIDYLIGTHPHEDHIGGLDNVIKNFEIGKFYMPKKQANTKTFEDVLDAASNKKLKINAPSIGDKFNVGDAECEVMSIKNEADNLNDCSIVIQMSYDGVKYLFTGDMESGIESSRTWNEVDILKVGHHGSKTSSSKEFINEINPRYSIISVGKNNRYGHPNKETLDNLSDSKIYRTDIDGSIMFKIKNNKLKIETCSP